MDVYAQDIMTLMDEWAPPFLAEKWDHPGLQIGNPQKKINRILVSLDVTRANIKYAINHDIHMIISHHPFLFKPIRTINMTDIQGKIIHDVIKNEITLFAAHTNLDTAKDGVNDALVKVLNLKECSGLVPVHQEYTYKVTAYLSAMEAKVLQKTVTSQWGNWENSTYILEDEDDTEKKVRMEFNVPYYRLDEIRNIINNIDRHISYDVYQLCNHLNKSYMGRVGYLSSPMTGKEAISYIKEKLNIPCIKYSGDIHKIVHKVAVLGGAGIEFADYAKMAKADLYLTADIKYHEAQSASEGIIVVDGGHFYTERVIVPALSKRLREEFEKRRWNVIVEEDQESTDIFYYL